MSGIKIAIDVACGMAGGQDDGASERLARLGLYAHHGPLVQEQALHAGLEVHLAAATQDLLAHILNHTRQLVGTDVRMGIH